MPIEEEWTGFDYGTRDIAMPTPTGLERQRILLVKDQESGRAVKFRMSIEEAEQFGKTVATGRATAVEIPKGLSEHDLRRGTLGGDAPTARRHRSERKG